MAIESQAMLDVVNALRNQARLDETALATKQTVGLPIAMDVALVSTSTEIDASVPFYLTNNDADPITITLPAAGSVLGKCFVIKRLGAGAVTIGLAEGDTLDGGIVSSTLNIGEAVMLLAVVESAWIVVSSFPAADVLTKTANFTADSKVPTYIVRNQEADVTVSLPPRASVRPGTEWTFKLASSDRAMILTPDGSDSIDGTSAPLTLSTQYEAITLVASADPGDTKWLIASRYTPD